MPTCPECGKYFMDNQKLHRHLKEHKKKAKEEAG
ncbi:MAG: hypothetical protein ACE5KH_05980, partial [Candidatus Geothermarchaeales archaeon]